MKEYVVFMVDLALALDGANSRGGKVENFDEVNIAQELACNEKNNWDLVVVYKRIREGILEEIAHYFHGKRYEMVTRK